MDEPKTKKEGAVADDRADPGEDGAWIFVRGTDAVRMVRRYLRARTVREWFGIALAGVLLWRFWGVPGLLSDIALAVKGR